MDLRQLNALLAVADTGSFSAAARQLHTVQSNVSTHVARLEKELGVVLVDRATGQLTEEGEIVARRARQIQAELDALAADVASLHDEVAGSVRLGVIGTTARWLVPPLLVAFTERHPKVGLVVVDATTSSLLPQLVGGRLDLAVVNLPVDDPDVDHRAALRRGPDPGHARWTTRWPARTGSPWPTSPATRSCSSRRAPASATCSTSRPRRPGSPWCPRPRSTACGCWPPWPSRASAPRCCPASAAPNWVGGDWSRVMVDGIEGRSVGLARRKRGIGCRRRPGPCGR